MPTAKSVAEWMEAELASATFLHQETAVLQTTREFGDPFAYINEKGNWTLAKNVLREFLKLTEGSVVWDRSERAWRKLGDNESYSGRQVE